MFFAFAGMALLVFVSVSPPAWDQVNFLDARAGGQHTVFGVLGECIVGGACSTRNVGYDLMLNGATNANINPTGLHNLTYILILHPIAGFFGLLALIMGIIGVVGASRFSTILMSIFSFIAAVLTLIVFVIDMVLWNLVKKRINDAGYSAVLGNANWLTIGAFGAFALATCTSLCGACGRFATGRSAGEKY